MKKECSNCEFNWNRICTGHGNVYQYGETIIDDTKCCNDWSENSTYFNQKITTAPRFLREAYHYCHISYQTFSELIDNFESGKPVPINIFDAIKHIYGISMIDIAVLIGVTYGVVHNAKTKGFAKKRIAQFSDSLCIPEKFLLNCTTNDFDELRSCKNSFFDKPNINETLESMPDWKTNLAREISAYLHCPIHIAKTIARVDHLYWNHEFSVDEYTESERTLINYLSRATKKNKPIHDLEYSLDMGCRLHINRY